MTAYIIRRLAISVPLLALIMVITFVFINLAPGDPLTAMTDPEVLLDLSEVNIERQRAALGLDKPIPYRFALWAGRILRGDLGYSYETGRPVLRMIAGRVWPTLELTAIALLISTVLGTIMGMIAAIRQYSLYDYTLSVAALFGVSIPTFFFALLALYLFALVWPIFPFQGYSSHIEGFYLWDNLYHLILPVTVLSIDTMAGKTRYARTAMLEVLKADYVTTARAKGLSEQVVILRHGFRNALIPLITVTMLRLPGIFGGTLLIETMFNWPGMGLLTVESAFNRDYSVLMGLTLIVSALVLLANLAADVMYAYADPRIRINK